MTAMPNVDSRSTKYEDVLAVLDWMLDPDGDHSLGQLGWDAPKRTVLPADNLSPEEIQWSFDLVNGETVEVTLGQNEGQAALFIAAKNRRSAVAAVVVDSDFVGSAIAAFVTMAGGPPLAS